MSFCKTLKIASVLCLTLLGGVCIPQKIVVWSL